MSAPFTSRRLWSHQQRAATFLYESDAAFLIAPLGAGKRAAALTALTDLIRDGHRRHALVIAPKLVGDDRMAGGSHLLAAPGASARRRARGRRPAREACSPRPAGERDVTAIGVDNVPWLTAELARLGDDHPLFDSSSSTRRRRLKDPTAGAHGR